MNRVPVIKSPNLNIRNEYLLLALGLAVTVIAYLPGLFGPFFLDDQQNLVVPLTENNLGSKSQFFNFVFTNDSGLVGRPVSMLSFALTFMAHGLESWAFKLHNLILHLITGVMLFLLARKVFRNVLHEEKKSGALAVITAYVWLLHPLLASTVLYSVQRMAILAALFTIIALFAYIHGREKLLLNKNREAWIALLLFFPVASLLSFFSKENGALIPFYVLLIEYVVFREAGKNGFRNPRILFCQLCFGVIPVILCVGYFIVNWGNYAEYGIRNFNQAERLMTELHIVFMYVKQIYLPRLSDLSLFHDVSIVREMDLSTIALLVTLLVCGSLIVLLRTKAPVVAFGIGWFLISHLLESTFIGLELVFEHRNYLASAGLLMIAVWGVGELIKKKGLRALVFMMVTVFLPGITFVRAYEWRDLETMLTVAVEEQPGSVRARTELANYLILNQKVGQAIQMLEETWQMHPEETGLILHQLILKCQNLDDITADVERAREGLVTYNLNPYTLASLESVISIFASETCNQLSGRDLLAIVDETIDGPVVERTGAYLSFLLRFRAYLNFNIGDYQTGFAAALEAYNLSGDITVFIELTGMLINTGFYDDARTTIERLKQMDAENYYLYTDEISRLEEALENRMTNGIPVNESADVPQVPVSGPANLSSLQVLEF